MDHEQKIVSNDNNPQGENHFEESEESEPVPEVEIERLSDTIDLTTNNEETQLKDETSTVLHDEKTPINATNEISSVKQDKQINKLTRMCSGTISSVSLGDESPISSAGETFSISESILQQFPSSWFGSRERKFDDSSDNEIVSLFECLQEESESRPPSVSLGDESPISSDGETFSIGESIQQQFKIPSSRIGSRKRKFDNSSDNEIVSLFECLQEESESRPASCSRKRTNCQILVDDALKWLTGLRSCKSRKTTQRKPSSQSRKRTSQNFPDGEC